MPRETTRHQQLRQRIAQLAAQLMMEHGIKDHALAKRKAARQLGLAAANGLPGNEEIDAELRTYAALYEPDAGSGDLDGKRRQAAEVMSVLAGFQPVLVGGLAQGFAARHADVELEIHSDSSKEFEQFLLNANIDFRSEERRDGPVFTLFSQPADVQVRILPVQSGQSGARAAPEVRRRLTLGQLRQLLARNGAAEGDSVGTIDLGELDGLAGSGE